MRLLGIAAVFAGAALLHRAAWALDPAAPLTQFDERVWDVRDGLPQSNVKALAQTRDGYLWVGTDGGLARFDGRRFTVFDASTTPGLRIHRIRALLVDGAGDLWIGTGGGPGLLRYRAGRFEDFEQTPSLRQLAIGNLTSDRDGQVWAGSWWGVLRVAGGELTRLPRLGGLVVGTVEAMAQDRAGAYWFGGPEGLLKVVGENAIRMPVDERRPPVTVTALLPADDGGLWIGTDGAGLFHRSDAGVRAVPEERTDDGGLISALHRDRDGTIWVAGHRGLGRLRDGRLEWARPGTPLAEPANTLFEDRDGNLWLGRVASGLLRLRQGPFRSLPPERFAGRVTKALQASRDGALWIGSDGGGVIRVKDGSYRIYRAGPDGLCTDSVEAMAEDAAGALWFGGATRRSGTVCRFDPSTEAFRSFGSADGLPPLDVHAITPLPDGALMVGTMSGLYRGHEGRFARVVAPLGVATSNITAIHQDRRGTLWVSVADGLAGLRPDGGTVHLTTKEGLSNGQVYAIDEDSRGRLWIGTLAGFSRVQEGRATSWKRAQGFLDDPVFRVLVDRDDHLWLCSSKGVFRVSAPAIDAFDADPRRPIAYTHFGSADGLKADECQGGRGQSAGARDGAGRLWFATARGAAWIDPRHLPHLAAPAPPLFESVLVNGRPNSDGPPPGRGELQIAYTAPELGHPDRLRFRYRLDPFDPTWVDAGDRRVAFYTNVPPGRYRMRVAVAIDMGEAAETTAFSAESALSVVLPPQWWERIWVRALEAAGLLGLAALAVSLWHRWRLARVEERHVAILTERNRIAQDLHDTLAQGFTGIAVQLEAASGELPREAVRTRDHLDRARALVRTSLTDARRAVWALEPEAAERGDLVAALSDIARHLSAQVPIRVQVGGTPRGLPPPFKAALVRIGQEALTNALRHARASNVALVVSFLQDELQLEVSDDGCGFDPAQVPSGAGGHRGLEGIRQRAHELRARLTVESTPGRGTRLAVTARYPA